MTFAYVSGRPSLDLVGTLKWRSRPQPEEQLDVPPRVGEWARGAGLVDALEPAGAGELERTLAVREALYRTVTTALAGGRPAPRDRSLLNATASGTPIPATLTASAGVRRRGTTDQLLTSVVLDAFDLLAGDQLDLVRECEADECTRLFVDSSHGRTRRWCGMAECGNRAKVRAYRQRQEAASAAAARSRRA
jgi:predicted RNA-binding Zn ribbon-like protein